MNSVRSISALLVFLAACGGAPTTDPAPIQLTDAHRIAISDSIRVTMSAFTQAIESMDAEAISSFYSDRPDMRWIEDGEIVYRSRREVAAAIRATNATMAASSVTYDGAEVIPVAPGVAVLVTGFAQQFTTHEGETGGFAGAITAVMVHEGDRWHFLSGHTSSVGNGAE